MTAIAVITKEDFAWVASDGAAYTPQDGVLKTVLSKVVLCPEWDCVITSRGMGGSAEAMRDRAHAANVRDFDDLLARAGALAREADTQLLRAGPGVFGHFTVILVGYSRNRQRFETHTVRTRPGPAWGGAGEDQVEDVPAFTVRRQSNLALFPAPPIEIAHSVGIPHPADGAFTVQDCEQYVLRSVLACRFQPGRPDGRPSCPEVFAVGGFVQLTRLGAHPNRAPPGWPTHGQVDVVLDCQVMHRWPDEIGREIDPTVGTLPAWVGDPIAIPEEAAD